MIAHDIYAKTPLSALVFTVVGLYCGTSILFPEFLKAIESDNVAKLAKIFNDIGSAVGNTKLAKAGSASLTTSNLATLGFESLLNGPHSRLSSMLSQLSDDPATTALCFALAYGMGWVLVNGAGPLQYPELQEMLKEEMGSVPEISYPVVGGKLAILGYELFSVHPESATKKPNHDQYQRAIQQLQTQVADILLQEENHPVTIAYKKSGMLAWLMKNQKYFSQLNDQQQSVIERQIESVFNYQEARSLKQMINPPKERSIAFMLLYVPLKYVPLLLRTIASMPVSIAALLAGRRHPGEPVKRSIKNLYHASLRDLSRLLICSRLVFKAIYTVITTPIKLVANLSSMLIGRIAGLFGGHPSRGMYKMMGKAHNFLDGAKHAMIPGRAIKKEQIAHANHTINESYRSIYKTVNKQVSNNTDKNSSLQDADIAPRTHSAQSLWASPSIRSGERPQMRQSSLEQAEARISTPRT